MIAKGGKKVQMPLRQAFCKAILGLDVVDEEPLRAVYQLDHLLDPEFTFTTVPNERISAVRLRRVRLVPKVPIPAIEYLEPKFSEYADLEQIRAAIGRLFGAYDLQPGQVSLTQVSIQLQFMSDGVHKGKTMTFNVTTPNTCDLKSKPDDVRVVGESCIKRWEILRD